MTEVDWEKLVERIKAGQEAAFVELVEIFLKPLLNFVFQFVRDQVAAEDLTQQTFIKVWKNIGRFDERKNLRTWIYIIAKHAALDYLKKKKEIPFSFFDGEDGNSVVDYAKDDNPLADELLERKDIAGRIAKLLERLPDVDRIILTMHYRDDFSLMDVSDVLDLPYNSVKSRHRRALGKLKEMLSRGDEII